MVYRPGGDLIPTNRLSRLIFAGDVDKEGDTYNDVGSRQVQKISMPRNDGVAEEQVKDR